MSDKNQRRNGSHPGNGEWLDPTKALTRYRPALAARSQIPEARIDPFRYGARTANVGFLIPSGVISEVVENLPVTPLPHTAEWFSGLANLRGTIVPVFNLSMLFGAKSVNDQRLLVMDRGERAVGIPIDQLPAPIGIGTVATHLPPLPDTLAPHVREAYLDDAQIWLEVNFPALFAELGGRIAQ